MKKIRLTIMSLFLLWSCTEQIKSVNNDKSLWGEYCIGETYKTLDELFVLEVKGEGRKTFALSPAGNKSEKFRNYYSTPLSKNDSTIVEGAFYQASTKILTSIPKGSKITIKEIKQTYAFSWFFGGITDTTVYGTVQTLKPSIQPLDLTNISFRYKVKKDYYLSKPNKNFLESEWKNCLEEINETVLQE